MEPIGFLGDHTSNAKYDADRKSHKNYTDWEWSNSTKLEKTLTINGENEDKVEDSREKK